MEQLKWSMDTDASNVITDAMLIVDIPKVGKQSFDLEKIFPAFMEYEQHQMRVIANGVKQKLADDVARASDVTLTPQEKKAEFLAMWKRLVSGYWFKPPSEKAAEKAAREAEAKKYREAAEKAKKVTDPKKIELLKELGLL